MSKKFMPDEPVPPWRVGVWVSSADPRKHVVMVAVGDEEIAEYEAHRDFVRWLEPDGAEAVKAAWANHKYAQGTKECIAFWRGAQWAHGLMSPRGVSGLDGQTDAQQTPVSTSICLPSGVMFDALGEPRKRYVRITHDGAHCIVQPDDVKDMVDSEKPEDYTLTDTYLSEREFEDLPEFDGF